LNQQSKVWNLKIQQIIHQKLFKNHQKNLIEQLDTSEGIKSISIQTFSLNFSINSYFKWKSIFIFECGNEWNVIDNHLHWNAFFFQHLFILYSFSHRIFNWNEIFLNNCCQCQWQKYQFPSSTFQQILCMYRSNNKNTVWICTCTHCPSMSLISPHGLFGFILIVI
jgi:hypothetical protein